MNAIRSIDAIFFDMNGTLRTRISDRGWQRRSYEKLLSLLELTAAPDHLFEELTRRYKAYTTWADEHEASLPEAEIWTRWLVPDLPPERIAARAAGLMLAFRGCRGSYRLKAGSMEGLSGLKRNGYRLGVISNTTSSLDLPGFIAENGLERYFEAVILSSTCGIRKPNPAIFQLAARRLSVDPSACAYVGNKPLPDAAGPKRAGFGMTVLIRPEGWISGEGGLNEQQPDQNTHQLSELLHIFPPRSERYL